MSFFLKNHLGKQSTAAEEFVGRGIEYTFRSHVPFFKNLIRLYVLSCFFFSGEICRMAVL